MRWHLAHMPWRGFAQRACWPLGFLLAIDTATALGSHDIAAAVLFGLGVLVAGAGAMA